VSTTIGLISDVHATADPVQEALQIFRQERVETVFCGGDIAGYGNELDRTVELLQKSSCLSILGNHDVWYLDSHSEKKENQIGGYFSSLPCIWESVIEGVHVYATHGSPPQSVSKGIRLLDEDGNVDLCEQNLWAEELAQYPFDVLIVGHTHQVFAERVGDKLVINPGSTKFNHTCALLRLPDLDVRIVPLSGMSPLKTWNWGMVAREGKK